MVVYPAVDILEGRCVRLFQGDFERKTTFSSDPVAVAQSWVEQGAEYLHLVDLDGARLGYPVNQRPIRQILESVSIPVQVGGGLRSLAQIGELLDHGAARVILGTALLDEPELAAEACNRHKDRIVAAIDARAGRVATHGWLKNSGSEISEVIASLGKLGLRRVIYTDIGADGTRSGPDMTTVREVVSDTGMAIIVSGGVASLDDLRKLKTLEADGVDGVVIGRALYDRVFSLGEAMQVAGHG